jgi:hypothetical protein
LDGWLPESLSDSVRALPGGILGRFDLLAALAVEDADEAAHGVIKTEVIYASK